MGLSVCDKSLLALCYFHSFMMLSFSLSCCYHSLLGFKLFSHCVITLSLLFLYSLVIFSVVFALLLPLSFFLFSFSLPVVSSLLLLLVFSYLSYSGVYQRHLPGFLFLCVSDSRCEGVQLKWLRGVILLPLDQGDEWQ